MGVAGGDVDPVIYNLQSRYAVGQRLNVNCSSGESRPAARLHWLVNGRIVRKQFATSVQLIEINR